ncbi:MAG: malonate transporter subunit MadM [Neisseriaceae bacterium]|nr:malonate transporter subunit MadM [Neisseriaceae bacterium]
MLENVTQIFVSNGLITSFALIGMVMYVAVMLSNHLTRGRIHGSAIAIMIGLALAYWGGSQSAGTRGLADIGIFTGIGLMGGGMLRDFAIISTAYGASFSEIKKAGASGVIALFVGILLSFVCGVAVAYAFGYRDAVSLTTIGGGAVTYIVGPVAGTALGASSDVLTISIAAGLIKSILTMIGTPIVAKYIGLNNPRAAMVYGGLLGTTSGVTAGLAATDPKLVPYGAVTATFYTGLGLLLVPSVLYLATAWLFQA